MTRFALVYASAPKLRKARGLFQPHPRWQQLRLYSTTGLYPSFVDCQGEGANACEEQVGTSSAKSLGLLTDRARGNLSQGLRADHGQRGSDPPSA
jgi:hypothetical protein